ncbi:MAG: GFA family protein [Amphiplicatus sp.]
MTEPITGGCQCGAVRYRIDGPLTRAHICHCRMCQKAAGNYFLPLANVQRADFIVTRSEIAWFQTSDFARRGFCRDCGTPLVYDGLSSPHVNVALGSLDHPHAVAPARQLGVEAKIPWFARLDALPGERTEEGFASDALKALAASNRQHPDHDTDHWPPGEGPRREKTR